MDKIASGEPAAFIDKNLFDEEHNPHWVKFNNEIRNNFIANDLHGLLKNLYNDFLNRIGIPTANTDKKERLITSEVNANTQQAFSAMDMSLTEVQRGIKQAIEMFPELEGNLSVKWRVELNGRMSFNNGDSQFNTTDNSGF